VALTETVALPEPETRFVSHCVLISTPERLLTKK
jgi:hypothetical protein